MNPNKSFISEIEEFLSASGMPPYLLGKKVLNDPSFVRDVKRNERSPSLKTVEKIRAFIKKYPRGVSQ